MFQSLNRNTLLALIHIYDRKNLPPESFTDKQVYEQFKKCVYDSHYWISWTREAILYCVSPGFKRFLKKENVESIQRAANDYEFLRVLAPRFRERNDARKERLRKAKAEKAGEGEKSQEGGMKNKKYDGRAAVAVGESNTTSNKNLILQDKKSKGKQPQSLSQSQYYPGQGPQLDKPLDINAFDEFMDLFLEVVVSRTEL
ncbi:hypothetical protein ABW19_dt0210021 [Dactylella cylindrospora]|nr:hypothetical protein ABW19_dt0210021 [Dactylella cylindrospora]